MASGRPAAPPDPAAPIVWEYDIPTDTRENADVVKRVGQMKEQLVSESLARMEVKDGDIKKKLTVMVLTNHDKPPGKWASYEVSYTNDKAMIRDLRVVVPSTSLDVSTFKESEEKISISKDAYGAPLDLDVRLDALNTSVLYAFPKGKIISDLAKIVDVYVRLPGKGRHEQIHYEVVFFNRATHVSEIRYQIAELAVWDFDQANMGFSETDGGPLVRPLDRIFDHGDTFYVYPLTPEEEKTAIATLERKRHPIRSPPVPGDRLGTVPSSGVDFNFLYKIKVVFEDGTTRGVELKDEHATVRQLRDRIATLADVDVRADQITLHEARDGPALRLSDKVRSRTVYVRTRR